MTDIKSRIQKLEKRLKPEQQNTEGDISREEIERLEMHTAELLATIEDKMRSDGSSSGIVLIRDGKRVYTL